MIPTVGRIVHYKAYGTPGGEYPSVERAAIITAVPANWTPGEPVDLVVFNPTGLHFNRAPFDVAGNPGTWRWPSIVVPMSPAEVA